MKKVKRSEILDYVTYEEQRPEIRTSAMATKKDRRIHVGDNLTFLFENPETVRYQVLEMVRTEKLVRESEIEHELKTYNELIGENGELFCTLLIEIQDEEDRAEKLGAWLSLPEKLYLKFEDGTRVYASIDERQRDEVKISSVQFLKFECKGRPPVAIGTDHPALTIETDLSEVQRNALKHDLL
jgi:hypothetical protein